MKIPFVGKKAADALRRRVAAGDAESGQTTLEFSFTFLPLAILIFAGLALTFALLQIAMCEYAVGQADWAIDVDAASVASDPNGAIRDVLAEKMPAIDTDGLVVKNAVVETYWLPNETWTGTAGAEQFEIDSVTKRTAARHVEADVTYEVAAVVPFTEITGLRRTVHIDRDVVITHDFRVDQNSPLPGEPEGGAGEGAAEEETTSPNLDADGKAHETETEGGEESAQ